MRTFVFYAVMALAIMGLSSCGSSKKVEKSPIETFVMPCSELVSGNGVFRAWGSGKSDSETSARKKAQMVAASELAAMLERTVKSTTEAYAGDLSESDMGSSKTLLIEKTKVTIEKSLKGAAIVCDRWTKDEATSQYTNYLVMELRGEEYLNALYVELSNNGNALMDKESFKKLFFKYIEENINK